MAEPLVFSMPFPPSVNGYWRKGFYKCRGRRIQAMMISQRGRIYRAAAIDALLRQGLTNKLLTGELRVDVVLFPPTRGKRDVDNFRKGIMDALTHAGFWCDDNQAKAGDTVMGPVVKGGAVQLRIQPWTGELPAWCQVPQQQPTTA